MPRNTDSSINSLFSEKIKLYADNLLIHARSLAGNTNDANDLLQETWYKAYKSCHTFKPGTNFKGWIKTIMYNTFISAYHKKSRYLRALREGDASNQIVVNSENMGEYNLLKNEWKDLLAQLDEKYKRPLELYGYGFNYFEISQKLGLTIRCVKSRIFIARQKLRLLYKNYSRFSKDMAS